MKRLFLPLVTFIVIIAALTACGQKGPLYLPDDEKAKKEYSKDRYDF